MSFARYTNYKPSGVEWIGSLPSHWDAPKLGSQLAAPPCYGVLVPDFEHDGVPMLRITDMEHGHVDRAALMTISHALSRQYQRTIVAEGDVVLSVVGTIGKTHVVGGALSGANLSRAVARIRVGAGLGARFLCWAIGSVQFERYVDLVCVGTAQRVLNMGDLSAFRLPLPAPSEQSTIAAFLDRETAKIDALVAEQQRLVDLLKEKRQAVISHAVTKGLNPDAPMKPSGVEWLGDVPAHWDVKRLKQIAEVRSGVAKGKDHGARPTVEVPYLRVANVQDGFLDLSEVATMPVPQDDLARLSLEAGDVLMNEGGDFDKLGRGCVWNGAISPCITQNHVFAVRSRTVSPEWISTITSSAYAQFYFMSRSKQSTNLASISSTNLMELPVLLPPEPEQAAIRMHTNRIMETADALTAEAERAIALLQERRTALISAAVTGQIDVRGLAAAEVA